jgi:CMP-N-acetylneuraminic acid synthetase
MPHIVAIVPMRHDSKRVPGKNWRKLGDRPLYHHIIRSLLACELVNEVVIDTDSPIILQDAATHFPKKVQLLLRPEHLRADTLPMNDVLLNTIRQAPADFYLQTHSTNPFLCASTINRALVQLTSHYPAYDSLFGVSRIQARLWDQLARPINHNASILLRTQDLPPVYLENSTMYIFTRELLEKTHNRIGQRPIMFEVGGMEATDIDTEEDFRLAEALYCGSH